MEIDALSGAENGFLGRNAAPLGDASRTIAQDHPSAPAVGPCRLDAGRDRSFGALL
jgi:hypothetical protein